MRFHPDRGEAARARHLGRFADARARGETVPPADDDQRTVDYLHGTLGPALREASAMPAGARDHLRETLMQTRTIPATPVAIPFGTGGTAHRISARFAAWQSAISLAVVLGFLVALVGIAYQRIPDSGPDGSDPGMTLGALTPYEGNGHEIMYTGPNTCVANERTYLDDDDLRAQGPPTYRPLNSLAVTTVGSDIATSIQFVYFGYLRCQMDLVYATPSGETDLAEGSSNELAETYLADRMRYTVITWSGLTHEERATVDAYYCAIDRRSFLTEFPLTLNGPSISVVLPSETDATTGIMMPAFGTHDVYRLSDGRYAAVIGSLSARAYLSWLDTDSDLASVAAGSENEPLTLVIFSRVGATYVIDQTILISLIHDAEPEWPRLPFSCMETEW